MMMEMLMENTLVVVSVDYLEHCQTDDDNDP